jgi:hypothetical protein
VYFQAETKSETKESSSNDNQQLINQLEKQVSIAVWIQFIGSIMESLYLSKIMVISEEVRKDENERQILLSSWVGSIGTFLDSIGTTTQALTSDKNIELEGEELSNFGDWIKVIGAILDAHAGTQSIIEEKEKLRPPTFFP